MAWTVVASDVGRSLLFSIEHGKNLETMTTTAPPKYDESFNNDAMIDDNDDEVADNRDDGDTVTFAAVQEPLTARTKRPRSFCRHCFVMCGGITVTVFSCVTH